MTTDLLVIEDDRYHLADVREFLEPRLGNHVIDHVNYATTLDSATQELTHSPTGILCDLFFPDRPQGAVKQNGQEIAQIALERGLPLVLITDSYHHGTRTNAVAKWASEHHIPLIDRIPEEHDFPPNGKAKTKGWRGGFLALTYVIQARMDAAVTMNKNGIQFNARMASKAHEVLDILAPYLRRVEKDASLTDTLRGLARTDTVLTHTLNHYYPGFLE